MEEKLTHQPSAPRTTLTIARTRNARRVAALLIWAAGVANVHAVGTATPSDIPGALVLDANVAANYVNNITVGASGNPPFTPGTSVFKLKTTQAFVAIRSYYTPSDPGKSGQAGGWVAPVATTRGISRAQLLDQLALPVNPDGTRNNTLALVLVPAGVSFWSGPAAAVTSSKVAPVGSYWGAGGGIQYYVGRNAGDIPGFQVPINNYVLAAPIGEQNLLAYSPRLSGNALRVGQYLDALAVHAYSDLDQLLTSLDMINLSAPAGDQKLQQAIAQLGAERYAALGVAGMNQSRQFMDQLSAASAALGPQSRRATQTDRHGNRTWLYVEAARAKQSSDAERTGYTQNTTLVVGGVQTLRRDDWNFGAAAGYLSSDLDWASSAPGNGKLESGYFGGYASYRADALLATGQLFVGYSRIETQRSISIPDAGLWPGYSFALNRTASGSTHALASGLRLDVAHLASAGQARLAPFVGLEYQRFDRRQFDENGAASANLAVQAKAVDDLRLRLGVSLELALGSASRLDWSLNGLALTSPRLGGQSGAIGASFQGQDGSFSSDGWRSPSVLNRIGIGLSGRGQDTDLALTYHYERGSGFAMNTLMFNADWRF